MNGKDFKSNENTKNNSKILLVDEVDVFFSLDYFGESYKPMAQLKHPQKKPWLKKFGKFTKVQINRVWILNFKDIENSPEFAQCK